MNKKEKNKINELKISITNNFNEGEKHAKVLFLICREYGLRTSVVCEYNLYEIVNSQVVSKESKEKAINSYRKYQVVTGQYDTLQQILKVLEG